MLTQAPLVTYDFDVSGHVVLGRRMVVVDVDLYPPLLDEPRKIADPAFLPGIDKDERVDTVMIDVLDLRNVKKIEGRVDEEVPDGLLLRARKDEDRIGVKLLCGHHGRKGVEIRIKMGGNDLHSKKIRATEEGCQLLGLSAPSLGRASEPPRSTSLPLVKGIGLKHLRPASRVPGRPDRKNSTNPDDLRISGLGWSLPLQQRDKTVKMRSRLTSALAPVIADALPFRPRGSYHCIRAIAV